MKVQCEICSKDVEVVTSVCCTKSNIDCGCGGNEYYEGHVLCDNCFDLLELLEIKGMAIVQYTNEEKSEFDVIKTNDCAEVE